LYVLIFTLRQQTRQEVLNWMVTSFTWIQSALFFNASNLLTTCFMLVSCLAYSSTWRGRQHDPPKCQLIFNNLHGVIS
jgi:hypothetical protein